MWRLARPASIEVLPSGAERTTALQATNARGSHVSALPISPISCKLLKTDPQAFADALGRDFVETGFAIVSDAPLEPDMLARALAEAKAFFALPEAAKLAYKVQGGAGQRGYTAFGTEAAKDASEVDLKEFWHVGREGAADPRMPPNLWPEEIPNFRPAMLEMFQALDALGADVLGAVALFLRLPPDFFAIPTRNGNSVLRLLHYPPMRAVAPGVRAAAHGDINVVTLLLGAEEAGLQAQTRDGSWLDINPPPGCVVLNVGDMLERLTNGYLPSTTHRVVNPAPERAHLPRYSTPFFLHFAPDFLIETLASCISPDRPNQYPEPLTAQDFLLQRLREIRLL